MSEEKDCFLFSGTLLRRRARFMQTGTLEIIKTRKQYHSKQMVSTFSRMLGVEFKANNKSIAEVVHNR